MKNTLKLTALLIAVLLLSCACSTFTGSPVSDERVLADAQRLYRNASLVVTGECLRTHTDENGNACSDVITGEILAGECAKDELIHCPGAAMKEGETYLLYLSKDDSAVFYTEDALGYKLLTEAPLSLSEEGDVSFGTAKLALESIREDIAIQNETITAPSQSSYYAQLDGLTDACDDIFIGRVDALPALSDTGFRTVAGGATVENTLSASVMRVEAYGAIKGSVKYGEMIEVVVCPSLCEDMTDATTLKSLPFSSSSATVPEEGGVYIFFLIDSPDDKQPYSFGVNPIQGLVKLQPTDRLQASGFNRALSGYYGLEALVKDIQDAMKS